MQTPFPLSNTPAVSHRRIMSLAGNDPRASSNRLWSILSNAAAQVRVQRPHPLGPRAFAGVEDRADRVVAATSRPVRSTRGALPAFPPVGFPEPPPEPAVRLVDAAGSPQVPLSDQ